MNLFAGYSPDQLELIDQLRRVARNKAAVEQAADVSAESVRRLRALGFWRRLYINTVTRCWSGVAGLLYPVSKWVPGVKCAAYAAARRVLQPPALYPELRARPELSSHGTVPTQGDLRGVAFQAIAQELDTFAKGTLSIEAALQIEEVARWIDERGADEIQVRAAMKRIRDGEALVETMKRGL